MNMDIDKVFPEMLAAFIGGLSGVVGGFKLAFIFKEKYHPDTIMVLLALVVLVGGGAYGGGKLGLGLLTIYRKLTHNYTP